MKKIIAALFLVLMSVSVGTQAAQNLMCSSEFSGIERGLITKVSIVQITLGDSTRNLEKITKTILSQMNIFDSYSDEIKVADQRLSDLTMQVENPYRSMNEIRNTFQEAETQVILQTGDFKDTINGNHAKWSIRKNFYEYELSIYQRHLNNLRKNCKN